MSWLKTLPIAYRGLLQDVRIVNFSVPMPEVTHLIPEGLKAADFDGRAMISLADLQIRQMRPKALPNWLSITYRHVALRLLVEPIGDETANQAIYFLKSFCASPSVICGAAIFTDYQLQKARIKGDKRVNIKTGKSYLSYELGGDRVADKEDRNRTARLNTAYAAHDSAIWQTGIKPNDWPLEAVGCREFSTNMFKNARLEAAYRVKGNLCFERSAPLLLTRVQRREHLRPVVRVRCSPL